MFVLLLLNCVAGQTIGDSKNVLSVDFGQSRNYSSAILVLPVQASSALETGSDYTSLEYWLYHRDLATTAAVATMLTYENFSQRVFKAGGYDTFGFANLETSFGTNLLNITIPVNLWVHIGIQFNTSAVTMYVNGKKLAEVATSRSFLPFSKSNIQRAIGLKTNLTFGGTSGFCGMISEVRLWSISRGDTIWNMWNKRLNSTMTLLPELVGYWRLNEIGNTAVDMSTPPAGTSGGMFYYAISSLAKVKMGRWSGSSSTLVPPNVVDTVISEYFLVCQLS